MISRKDEDEYDAEYASDVPDYFKCALCNLVLRDPIQIMDCGHRFCRSCFDRVVEPSDRIPSSNLVCPIDHETLDDDQVFEDKVTQHLIGDLDVKCCNDIRGCKWIGELPNLVEHDQECLYRNDPIIIQEKEENPVDELKLLFEQIDGCKEDITLKHDEAKNEKMLQDSSKISCDGRLGGDDISAKTDNQNLKWPKSSRLREKIGTSGRMVFLKHLKGLCDHVTIVPENFVQFHNGGWCTVGAPRVLVQSGVKCFFEVTVYEGNGCCILGWASNEWITSKGGEVIGFGPRSLHSYGFEVKHGGEWHNNVGTSRWSLHMEQVGDVIGVAIDTKEKTVMYGCNGVWKDPMTPSCVPFDDIFPAISGWCMRVFVNFGEDEFKYGPPDASYKEVLDVI